MKKLYKALSLIMALAMMLCMPIAAHAAPVAEATIDCSRTGSMDIYKYDLTNSEKDGIWDSSYVSTGVKDENGVWQKVPFYQFDDPMPYGHGEKSVYILSGFMRLSREEAFAIRYHMGFSGNEDKGSVGKVFEQFPLAFALSVADMEATYFLEGK